MRYLIGLLVIGGLWAQSTTYQNLWSAATPNNNDVSASVNNIGQSQHLVSYVVTSLPTKTCTYPTALRIEGSFDNSNFVAVSPTSYAAAGPTVSMPYKNTVFGYGAYPYVHVRIITHDQTNCRVSVWYTGTVFPASLPDMMWSWSGFLNMTNAASVVTVIAIASEPSGGSAVDPGRITLYGLTMYQSAGAQVLIQCRNAALTVNLRDVILFPAPAADTQIILPTSRQAYAQCLDGEAMAASVAGTPAGTTRINTIYRFE